ncbi:hypothetical protein [Pseudomonas sp. Hp2]|uniref:Uncharacterized protein n=1 Tax=Xanthomonas boreopolis TaxID=86183 RepID=A0A919KGK0_9XANT|nr:hypothetical protein [Pseudomonas sp. Hp2]GHH46744.1 hypothetical protein GCM10009090_02290 [[Pseudomonas] boreopolis]
MRKPVLRGLQWLGALWTLPNSLLGLALGAVGLAGGARVRWSARELALVFERWPWGPGGALTLGNVILLKGESLDLRCSTYEHHAGRCRHPPIRLGDHERAHVFQYLLLGPLFLPVYLACGGVSVRNPFERAADHYALHGHGWWPGSRRSPGAE